MDKIDFQEKIWGFVLGVIAIIAIIFEMIIAGFELSSVAGGIKDIAGTILDVIMLILVFKAFLPKKKIEKNFEQKFKNEMDKIIAKYSPLICADETISGRYNIAEDMSVLYQNVECKYSRLFDFDYKKGEISFFVHKKLFMGVSKESFDDKQKNIITNITNKILIDYSDNENTKLLNNKYTIISDGFKLKFNEELIGEKQAENVAQIIDKIILLYIVEYKK